MLLLGGENLNFFLLCDLGVELFAPGVLVLAEVTVLDNHVFALGGSPDFVLELFFLSSLPLHQVKDHLLAFFVLQLVHELFLLTNKSSASLGSSQPACIVERLLRSLLESCRSQGKRAGFGLHLHLGCVELRQRFGERPRPLIVFSFGD